jgi:O-acetyl-ADP-ribose deacetylase (regulator of RNase III)
MQWTVEVGDILRMPADVLICSANVFLTLSGGVGGALLLEYGDAPQAELRRYLAERNLRHVERGDVIVTRPASVPWRAVLHAVAIDGLYASSAEFVCQTARRALELAAETGARRVALTALATGYGRLSMAEFGAGVALLRDVEFSPIAEVVIVVRRETDAATLRQALQAGVV